MDCECLSDVEDYVCYVDGGGGEVLVGIRVCGVIVFLYGVYGFGDFEFVCVDEFVRWWFFYVGWYR